MSWINYKSKVHVDNKYFNSFINGFVLECPSSIKHEQNIGKNKKGKKRRLHMYL